MDHVPDIAKAFLVYLAVLIVILVAVAVWNRGHGASPATAASISSSQN